jgi:hypothetical protein
MKIIENTLFLPKSRGFLPLITVGLEVRVIAGPPRNPLCFNSLPRRYKVLTVSALLDFPIKLPAAGPNLIRDLREVIGPIFAGNPA